jgi:hypothetical protein
MDDSAIGLDKALAACTRASPRMRASVALPPGGPRLTPNLRFV